jgi:uncharacterized protein (UPF0548 family)
MTRPSEDVIREQAVVAETFGQSASRFLSLTSGVSSQRLPAFFSRDYSQSRLGEGARAFAAARRLFARWDMFNLGWVRVVNTDAQISPEQIVGVEAHSLGLWSLNFSRIIEVVDSPTSYGFLYATTQFHIEEGEERFLVTFDAVTGAVMYTLEAISRPRDPLARLGFPVTRTFQHRFARDSHRRMNEAVLAARA